MQQTGITANMSVVIAITHTRLQTGGTMITVSGIAGMAIIVMIKIAATTAEYRSGAGHKTPAHWEKAL